MKIECRSTCVWCNRAIEDATWLVDRRDGRWHNDCANEVLIAAYQHKQGLSIQAKDPDHSKDSLEPPATAVVDEGISSGPEAAALCPIKRCSKCGRVYPATPEYFHRSHGKLKPYCKRCAIQYWHEYYSRKGKAKAGSPSASAGVPEPPAPAAPAAPPESGRWITPEDCRHRREVLQMTRETLARRADVGDTALERFEAGRANLSESALRRLHKALLAADVEGSPLG